VSVLESLFQQAGFTDYEARAYLALCQHIPQTGYELAKTSRIPRANIYEVLKKLEDRGAATRVVTADVVRYRAVHPDAVLERMKHDFHVMMNDMESRLIELEAPPEELHVEQFEGYENLLGLARHLLARTESKLLAGIHPPESEHLGDGFVDLIERKISVGVLCLNGCTHPCGACKGEFFSDPLARASSDELEHPVCEPIGPSAFRGDQTTATGRTLVLVSDGSDLLAASIQGNKVSGIRTRLPLLTEMAGLYLEQSILLSVLRGNRMSEDTLFHRLHATFLQHSALLQGSAGLLRRR